MIDLGQLREYPGRVTALIKKKDPLYDVQKLLALDAQLKAVRIDVEELRRQKNDIAMQGKSGITPELRQQSIDIGKKLKEQEDNLKNLEIAFRELYLFCPNIPKEDIPEGGKESNKPVQIIGQKPTFSFPVKNHVELGELNGWFDFKAAATMTGSNFVLYKGDAVRLMYALTALMLKNNTKHGYQAVIPPYLITERSLETASNFPKFRDQVYSIPQDGLYLSPTAEVNLTNIYRDHIFMTSDLPVRVTAWSSCFRREAGSYGGTERGLIRIHQFEKVELYTICEPQESDAELDRMLACAQDFLNQLGLHYRVSLLAAQDCSFASAKTYDIEVWLPGQGTYYEVSSASNCTDFQARRGSMRYKKSVDSKTELVHTLNCSSLALPRLMVALMEVYQQPDGTIALPAVVCDAMPF